MALEGVEKKISILYGGCYSRYFIGCYAYLILIYYLVELVCIVFPSVEPLASCTMITGLVRKESSL